MGGSLFQFRVSEPLEERGEIDADDYDPDAQIGSWTGSASAAALTCTTIIHRVGREKCNAYSTYCATEGGAGYRVCDS